MYDNVTDWRLVVKEGRDVAWMTRPEKPKNTTRIFKMEGYVPYSAETLLHMFSDSNFHLQIDGYMQKVEVVDYIVGGRIEGSERAVSQSIFVSCKSKADQVVHSASVRHYSDRNLYILVRKPYRHPTYRDTQSKRSAFHMRTLDAYIFQHISENESRYCFIYFANQGG